MLSPTRTMLRSLCVSLLLILAAGLAGAADIPLDEKGLPQWQVAVFDDFPVLIRLDSTAALDELLAAVPIADFSREQVRIEMDTPFSGQVHLRTRVTEGEAHALSEAGYGFERLPDLEQQLRREMEATWADQVARGGDVARIGERGVYHTYTQLGQILQDTETAHPTLASVGNAGYSVQGRNLWTITLSADVDNESAEPELRISGNMHGNEKISMELSLYLIDYLTDNYGQAGYEDVTYLMDNYEIHMMPLHNPDGHVLNQRQNANGVDLNRNFPVPNGNIGGDGTWTEEVETVAMKGWALGMHDVISQDGHSGALVVNYPWDYTYTLAPDNDALIALAEEYSYYNEPMWNGSFYHGITNGAQWYVTEGSLQDWCYHETNSLHQIMEFSDSYAPPQTQLDAYWDDNRESFMHWIKAARYGINGVVTASGTGLPVNATVTVVGNSKTAVLDPDFGDYYKLLDSGTYDLIFEADGYITQTVYDVSTSWGTPTVLDVQMNPTAAGLVSGTVHEVGGATALDATIEVYTHPGNSYVTTTTSDAGDDGYYELSLVYGDYLFEVSADNHLSVERVVTVDGPAITEHFLLPFSETLALIGDDFESGNGDWTLDGDWALTTESYHSSSHSMTDSPGADYENYQDLACTSLPVNLASVMDPQLSFWAKWEIELNWDAVQFEISTDGGSSWTALFTEYTVSGSGQGEQPSGEPVFEGTQNSWVLNTVDLTAYEDETDVRFRFMLRTDTSQTYDGFYFDDFLLEGQVVGTGAPEQAVEAARLHGNWPNPFNPTTTLRFSLGEAGPVELAVFDVRGRRLATLARGTMEAGEHECVWDGRDENGRPLSSGVYLARLAAGERVQETKLTLIK